MDNFTFYNPVKLLFGRGSIASLSRLVPSGTKVLVTYGGGSIHLNGVYTQITDALDKHQVFEFGGIEPNPRYETLMRAVDLCRKESIEFLVAAGGGSVLDGTKFIAAATKFADADPWKILAEEARIDTALPIGCILTLPATGSEMNAYAVISRESTQEKLAFGSPKVFPQFSILDPETTYSLPPRQSANGVVDTFVHVMEQYMTFPVHATLQDRQAEAILLTLLEEGPKVLHNPEDYDIRANLMWCATQALNGTIACGVPQDWSTHGIGHELTAFYGIDHAQSLAIVWPGVCHHQLENKLEKLAQFGHRVLGINGNPRGIAQEAIAQVEHFFENMGVSTHLSYYGISAQDAAHRISARLAGRKTLLGEKQSLGPLEISEILRSRA